MLSDRMEDYIKVIYLLEEETGERVPTSAVAEQMDVSPPSVSSMLSKLEERGFVDREEYGGATLTEEGELVALEILRHHRLLEQFLVEALDYDWSEVHDEADRLEHHISERFERRLAEVLDNPDVDPHGDPIPDPDLELPEETEARRLTDLAPGDRIEVTRIRHRGDEELAFLADHGIRPGAQLELLEEDPFDMITVAGENGEETLPRRVARLVEGEAVPEASTE
ncbi:DtxR family transcriptional regulator [Halobacteriales archaeon QS_8_69_26]|nr:MAG: DtxR family transcriptional regulator [Halobacteriales archaeon QS_8_69_26]